MECTVSLAQMLTFAVPLSALAIFGVNKVSNVIVNRGKAFLAKRTPQDRGASFLPTPA